LTPPYLYNADGSMAIRPTIQSAPKSTRAGADINVVMDTSGSHTFALIRASAVTHSVNNDQRRVPLAQVIQTDSNFRVRIPTNRNVSLLGHYFLFAINANGVPSVGATIRIIL
jgi:galactose oxidase